MPEFREHHVQLSAGTVRVRETGDGPVVVFVHGALVDGTLWDGVVEHLAPHARCVVPDLPLGAHRTPLRPGAPWGPPQAAALIAELLDALGLDDVTLVGNDTGGALCQLVVTTRPERVGRLVLTNCDAFEVFPPRFFVPLVAALRLPGMARVAATLLRPTVLRHSPLALGGLVHGRLDATLTEGWRAPLGADAGVRRDLRTFLQGASNRQTLDAATRFGRFDKPVLLVWGTDDPFFGLDLGRRLEAAFPDARLVEVPGAACFVMLDAPERVAELVREALPAPVAA